ncbi:Gfo/Idh/MocA family protein [Ovoidimarina sediminis]|uniref:Gfo/Idh/MocA family protein n=1 Tax=Ovoidimarina sediminis TaxID=3079856 RepID=UPI002911F8A2|nr:Gfo/Idh/MocA family oxidoreductase [Rhodophyticola sp. MJ-SS7]MDU8943246.1 Gfo/Idh/MocA family oxidoreductase [Rhodophyticola sp. MJ-SS7]
MPDNPVNVALIGTGMVGATYAAALADLADSIRLTRVLARSPGSAERFINAQAGPLPFRPDAAASLTEIAEDPGIGFVILATPPDQRQEIVEALAAAGKPILMEKPIERTLAAAARLCQITESAGIPLGIVLQHRVRPSARHLAAWIADETPGPLRAAEISVPWWRPQSYYDTPGRGTYARDGGGVLLTQAIHTLDLALTFTPPITSLTAMTATTGFHDMEAEDFVTAGLTFEGGAVGTLFATTAAFPGRTEEIRLHYRDASVALRAAEIEINRQDGSSETIGTVASSGAGADPMAFTSDWHRDVIADFAAALRKGHSPVAPARSALAAHALIDAIERAARSGAPTQPEIPE